MVSNHFGREQFVGIEGCRSSSLRVLSGVPQGSVFGPLIFISYINHVTEVISQGSSINMFADDMALYRVIKSNNNYTQLQNDVNAVSTFMNSTTSIQCDKMQVYVHLQKDLSLIIASSSTLKWNLVATGSKLQVPGTHII